MKSLKSFIIEETKNKHLEHLEDEIINRGIAGLRDSITFIQGLRNMLAGHSKVKVNVTVKWDGAPAIVCGIDPETKDFFIGTKSVFNKEPKMNFNVQDIDFHHTGNLAEKLKTIFPLLESLNITEVLQGDLLYTKEDLKAVTIDGEKCVAFRPNTITYAVPIKSELGQRILKSKMGIVFHTTYKGKTIESMKANFGANVDKYKHSSALWVNDAYYRDESGTATMTEEETAEVTALLSLVRHLFRELDPQIINSISADINLKTLIKTFNNAKVREGKAIKNVNTHVRELINFINDKYRAEIDALKTDQAKKARKDQLKQVKSFIDKSKDQLLKLFEIQILLTQAKNIIIQKLQSVKNVGTFLETNDGFKVTAVEGFVAIDTINGNAVKLVDRLEFSTANFNAAKNW